MTKQAHVFVDRSYMDAQLGKEEFKSDNRYRKQRNRKDNEELEELKRLEQEHRGVAQESEGDPEVESVKSTSSNNNEDTTDWKKRYSDLRSHTSKLENSYKESISSLEKRLKELEQEKQKPVYPKTEEEIEEWVEKYPDVAGIIKTIAGKTSEEAISKVQARIDSLAQKELEIERRTGIKMLLERHPDFNQIKDTEHFRVWLSEQTAANREAILSPKDFKEDSVKEAARVIDFYKFEAGLSTKKPKDNTHSEKDAARKVSTSVNEDPRKETQEQVFYESQVAKMTDREFEKLQDKILEAQRKGNFVYDLSGAAR